MGVIFFCNIGNSRNIVSTEAVVKYVGDDYIIVNSNDGDEYKLEIDKNDDYAMGEVLDLELDNVNVKTSPMEASIKKADILNKNISFVIDDEEEIKVEEKHYSSDEDNVSDNSNNGGNSTSVSDNNGNLDSSNSSVSYTESDVVNYFNELNSKLDNSSKSGSISQSLKDGFVSVVDFLFYDKPIRGKTFKELSSSAKLQVLKVGLAIDSKIEKYFPDYKRSLSSKYQSVKSKIVTKYLDITSEVCENNGDVCNAAREGFSDMKKSFSLTWSFIKDIAGSSASKISSWYKVWKNS